MRQAWTFHPNEDATLADAVPCVTWYYVAIISIGRAACIYFWSGSVAAATTGLIFVVLCLWFLNFAVGHLIYEIKVDTRTVSQLISDQAPGPNRG